MIDAKAIATILALAAAGDTSVPAVPFAVASVHLEQNATDGDFEVVFEVKAGAEGLAKLAVVAPDGRTVVDFTAPDASTLGMRQFRFESPEPQNLQSMKAAYPEGAYTFTGATAAGGKLQSTATLHHQLPVSTSFLRPRAEAQGVSATALVITWTPVKNVAAYVIAIEQDELNVNITARVPGSMARFRVPDGFLAPGTAYTLEIGTVTAQGNISLVETTFTTAGAP